jgi:hypothetical protein
MNRFPKFHNELFGEIREKRNWVQFIPLITEGVKALVSLGETAKGPSNKPINSAEYNTLADRKAFLQNEKKKIQDANGWFWSSAGDLSTIENKLTQVNSALAAYDQEQAAKVAHQEEVTAAEENIETEKERGLKTLAERRSAQGLKGAGEIYNPDTILLENVASAEGALKRGENVYDITQKFNQAMAENVSAQNEAQNIKQSNQTLLNLGLNLGGTVAGQFAPGGMWGGPGESNKALTAINDQNKLFASYLLGTGEMNQDQILKLGYGPLASKNSLMPENNSILNWSNNKKIKNWWE